MFLYFFIFYYRLHCLVHNTHSLVLQCLSSSGVFDDWTILFAYLTGFKTVLPLSVKDVFCVYAVCLCPFFLSAFIGVMWPGQFLITSNSCKTTTPGGDGCMCTFCCLRNGQNRPVGGCFLQPDVEKRA